MHTLLTVVGAVFLFGLGFLIGNGFHEAFRYMPMKDKMKKEASELMRKLDDEQFKRQLAEKRADRAEKHMVFEHIFKIETDSDRCDLFENW